FSTSVRPVFSVFRASVRFPGMMRFNDLKGWLPIDAVVVDGRPGVSWFNMEGVSLDEPFFHQTVARARAEHRERQERFTEFDALIEFEKTVESVAPTGFIFHSSRCGSTLLANACRAISKSIILSEPTIA